MRATPDELIPLHAPFDVVVRGFKRQQVLDHIESLEGEIAMIAADRDAALRQVADLTKLLDHLRHQAEEAIRQVDRLQRASLGAAGIRVQHLLQVAEDEITALQAESERHIARREAECNARVERELGRLAAMQSEVAAQLSAAHRVLAEAISQIHSPSPAMPSPAKDGQLPPKAAPTASPANGGSQRSNIIRVGGEHNGRSGNGAGSDDVGVGYAVTARAGVHSPDE